MIPINKTVSYSELPRSKSTSSTIGVDQRKFSRRNSDWTQFRRSIEEIAEETIHSSSSSSSSSSSQTERTYASTTRRAIGLHQLEELYLERGDLEKIRDNEPMLEVVCDELLAYLRQQKPIDLPFVEIIANNLLYSELTVTHPYIDKILQILERHALKHCQSRESRQLTAICFAHFRDGMLLRRFLDEKDREHFAQWVTDEMPVHPKTDEELLQEYREETIAVLQWFGGKPVDLKSPEASTQVRESRGDKIARKDWLRARRQNDRLFIELLEDLKAVANKIR